MEAMEITARKIQNIDNDRTGFRSSVFSLEDVGRDFGTGFLDEGLCREWVLEAIHGRGEKYCPKCRAILTEISLQRFRQGGRVCCRACGKYFTALTGTFLAGCHMTFREIILLAVFLHFGIPARIIAEKLNISTETVRLWKIKFRALERVKQIPASELEGPRC